MRKVLNNKGEVIEFLPDKGKKYLSESDIEQIEEWSNKDMSRQIKYLKKRKKAVIVKK